MEFQSEDVQQLQVYEERPSYTINYQVSSKRPIKMLRFNFMVMTNELIK